MSDYIARKSSSFDLPGANDGGSNTSFWRAIRWLLILVKTNEIENNWNNFLFVGWIVCHRHATLKKSFKKFKSLERDTSFEEELIDRYALASACAGLLIS